jgi:hypothetical protein
VYNKIILSDLQKSCIQVTIRTHEFFDKNFEEAQLHPEVRKNLEVIDYHMKYNLPIEKRILFETVPELFKYEIGQLTDEERLKYRNRRIEIIANDGVLTKSDQVESALINKEYMIDKILEMKLYLHWQQQEFTERYKTYLNQAISWGWGSVNEYLYAITIKDKDKLTVMEKTMLEELTEFEQVKEEIMTLEEVHYNAEQPLQIPFPMSEKLKAEYIETYKHFKKYRTVNLLDTYIIPRPKYEDSFMDRLRKLPHHDIDEEIKLSNEKYKKLVNSGMPVKGRDMNAKDPEVIRMVNIVSQAVKKDDPLQGLEQGKREMPVDYLEEFIMGQIPTDGRILVEEYFRLLHVNNEDPEKYNFTYWEKYFNVSKITLRNIFNYVFFPIPDANDNKEVGKILYFKDFEYAERRKLIADMSSEEYNKYLEETQTRPELQELKRLDYIEYQKTATEPRISDRTVLIDDIELDERIDKPLLYSDVIKEIDERISKLVKEQVESLSGDVSKTYLEKDIQLQIENLKIKRIEFENKKKEELPGKKIDESKKIEHNQKKEEDTNK